MPRYITRKPRADDDDLWWETHRYGETITVYEPDDDAQPTGILDARGEELWRVRERAPMGYRVKV